MHFAGQAESKWLSKLLSWIFPAVIVVAILGLVMKRMGEAGGLMEVGKSKAKVYMENWKNAARQDGRRRSGRALLFNERI